MWSGCADSCRADGSATCARPLETAPHRKLPHCPCRASQQQESNYFDFVAQKHLQSRSKQSADNVFESTDCSTSMGAGAGEVHWVILKVCMCESCVRCASPRDLASKLLTRTESSDEHGADRRRLGLVCGSDRDLGDGGTVSSEISDVHHARKKLLDHVVRTTCVYRRKKLTKQRRDVLHLLQHANYTRRFGADMFFPHLNKQSCHAARADGSGSFEHTRARADANMSKKEQHRTSHAQTTSLGKRHALVCRSRGAQH